MKLEQSDVDNLTGASASDAGTCPQGTFNMADETTSLLKVNLACSTGEIEAKIGEMFTDKRKEWEIVGFQARYDEMTAFCKPVDGILPSYWRTWKLEDGSVAWCGDSVAAALLEKVDGKPRDARGYFLTKPVCDLTPRGFSQKGKAP